MKIQNIYHLLQAALLLLLVSCTQEEFPAVQDKAQQLTISVTDGGYTSAVENMKTRVETRAVENGYTTEFTEGDACGLYIVRNGSIVESNLKLIAETSSSAAGELVWKVRDSQDNDVKLYHVPDYRSFVYYPYQTDMADKVNAGADDDAGFFAPLINDWQPRIDQSDYKTGYTASDLMTASGSISGKNAAGNRTLTFAMIHRMAMAVLDMPKTVYKFTNFAPAIPDYIVRRASSVQFDAAACPCAFPDGNYRYLFNPTSGAKLSASYDDGQIHEFDIDIAASALASGTYKTYKVDGRATVMKHTLRVGDFFLADGNLLSKNANASVLRAANVVGIVFQTNRSRIGAKEKEKLGENNVHGLVMSVRKTGTDLRWGPNSVDETLTDCVTRAQNYRDISGYGNCELIRASRGNFDMYPAFKAADEYNTTCPVPTTTTGWYLPASGQWWDILQNLGGCPALADVTWQTSSDSKDFTWLDQGNVPTALNKWMENIADGDKDTFSSSVAKFWVTSSEYSNTGARYWAVDNTGRIDCYWQDKGYPNYDVRPVLAF